MFVRRSTITKGLGGIYNSFHAVNRPKTSASRQHMHEALSPIISQPVIFNGSGGVKRKRNPPGGGAKRRKKNRNKPVPKKPRGKAGGKSPRKPKTKAKRRDKGVKDRF